MDDRGIFLSASRKALNSSRIRRRQRSYDKKSAILLQALTDVKQYSSRKMKERSREGSQKGKGLEGQEDRGLGIGLGIEGKSSSSKTRSVVERIEEGSP